MTASVPDDLEAQVRELRAIVREMQRPRSRYQPNMRDLRDAALTQVQDGEVPVYSSATGKWEPGAGGSGIDPTIVNAKGDLIVGTADDMVDRLPVGVNGQVLTADSAQTGGMRWTTDPGGLSLSQPLMFPLVGEWLIPYQLESLFGAQQVGTSGLAAFSPLDLPAPMTFDRIAIHVSTAGTGVNYNYRLGIYPDSGNSGRPHPSSAPTLDAGTVNVTSVGVKEIVISLALAAGRWWGVAVPQATSVSAAVFLTSCNRVPLVPTATFSASYKRWEATGLTGALPSTLSVATDVTARNPIAIGLRRSA